MKNWKQSGFSLIEILVTVSILAVGLLGLAGLQLRALNAERESYARGQALMLVDEMAERIIINKSRAAAGEYGSDLGYGAGSTVDCSAPAGALVDLCDWSGSLQRGTVLVDAGSNETSIGTLHNPIGCVAWDAGTSVYTVSVTWWAKEVITGASDPVLACDVSAIPVANRRTVIRTVRLATLGA